VVEAVGGGGGIGGCGMVGGWMDGCVTDVDEGMVFVGEVLVEGLVLNECLGLGGVYAGGVSDGGSSRHGWVGFAPEVL
jgi:hypothetical protein